MITITMQPATMQPATMQPATMVERLRRQRRQRGAAVFVVVLVVTLLSALGIFALRSASSSNISSGYNRQLTQTHYVTDTAVAMTLAEMSRNPEAVKTQMMKPLDPNSGDALCEAYQQITNPTCWMRGYDDFSTTIQIFNSTEEVLIEAAPNAPGSLGPMVPNGGPPLDADMRVELTDLHPARPVRGHEFAGGADASHQLRYVYITVSATGLVRPRQQVIDTWDTRSATAAGVQEARAHVFMGPVLMAR